VDSIATIISPDHQCSQDDVHLFLVSLLPEVFLLAPPSAKAIFGFVGMANMGSLPFQFIL
jgi:hypothetical protein